MGGLFSFGSTLPILYLKDFLYSCAVFSVFGPYQVRSTHSKTVDFGEKTRVPKFLDLEKQVEFPPELSGSSARSSI